MGQLMCAHKPGNPIITLLGVGVLLLTAVVGCHANLSAILGAPTLPPGTIALEFTDIPQSVVTLPVYRQLLIRACKQAAGYDGGNEKYDCDLGLLDLETEHLVRLAHLVGEGTFSEIVWSPDGMQFSYHNSFSLFVSRSPTSIYCADGRELCNFDSFDAGSWSVDGSHFIAWTCEGPKMQPGQLIVIYDAVSWEPIRVFNGSPMVCAVAPPRCSLQPGCLPEEASKDESDSYQATKPSDSLSTGNAPREYQSDRYQATIEDSGLRVFDTKTNTEKTYAIPGYRIMTIAWAPNS